MVKNVNRTARSQWKVDTIKNCINLQWGPILGVMSPALGYDDSSLDQSATSIQILLWSRKTVLIKLMQTAPVFPLNDKLQNANSFFQNMIEKLVDCKRNDFCVFDEPHKTIYFSFKASYAISCLSLWNDQMTVPSTHHIILKIVGFLNALLWNFQ